jgi:hypothetical protein
MSLYSAMAVMFLTAAGCSSANHGRITQEELVRRTQQLMDSVAGGDQTPWKKYFAEDCMYFDEKGRSMDKAAMVKDIAPLPTGYSGSIRIVNPQSRVLGDTAVLSYDMDETETVFGQEMKARYHATDTWIRRNGEWQIVAGQVLRYYEDPSPGKAEPGKYKDYAGRYELSPGNTMAVTIEGLNLYSQRAGRAKDLLVPEAPDIFFRKGIEGRRLFRRTIAGKVDALIDRRNNEDIVWKKIN